MICKIRLGTTEATLRYMIQAMKIPYPELPLYNDHSTKVTLSTGGEALRGFRSTSFSWEQLDWHQAYMIRQLAEDAIDSADGMIYATVNRAWNRSGDGQDWIDIKGYPNLPTASPVANTKGRGTSSFTLTIGGLLIINDPSTAV